MISLIVTVALLFLTGYASQRASVCAVAAAREIVEDRRVNRLLGFLLSAAAALTVMALDERNGNPVFTHFPGSAPRLTTVIGAVLFGIGAWRNGRCAMGTLAALAAGQMTNAGTLVGLFIGIALGNSVFLALLGSQMMGGTFSSPLVTVDRTALVLAALAVLAILWALLHIGLRHAPKSPLWSPVTTMLVIGGASGGLYALDRNWPYTTLFGDIVRGTGHDIGLRIALTGVLLAGSFCAARTGRLFILQPGTRDMWLRAIGTGVIMGVGASLVPGGNEAMLLTGFPLLLPNLMLGYAVVMITLITLAAWGQRSAARPAAA